MKTACNRGVLVGVFSLCLSCLLTRPQADCQSSSTTSAKLTETAVIPKLGAKSECPGCSTDTFDLSPDGIHLAHMHTDYRPGVTGTGNSVEVCEIQTAQIVATFQMPMPPMLLRHRDMEGRPPIAYGTAIPESTFSPPRGMAASMFWIQ